jgi:hypothetical protein
MSTLWCPRSHDSCLRVVSSAWTLPSLGNMTQCHRPILTSLLNSSNDTTVTKGRRTACRYVPSCLYGHFLINFMLVSCNAVTFMGQVRYKVIPPTLVSTHQTRNITVLQYALLSSSNPLQPIGQYTYHLFNIQQFYVLPTQCVYVLCMDLRTNSDYIRKQH